MLHRLVRRRRALRLCRRGSVVTLLRRRSRVLLRRVVRLLLLRRLGLLGMHQHRGGGQRQAENSASGNLLGYFHEICSFDGSLTHIGILAVHKRRFLIFISKYKSSYRPDPLLCLAVPTIWTSPGSDLCQALHFHDGARAERVREFVALDDAHSDLAFGGLRRGFGDLGARIRALIEQYPGATA